MRAMGGTTTAETTTTGGARKVGTEGEHGEPRSPKDLLTHREATGLFLN